MYHRLKRHSSYKNSLEKQSEQLSALLSQGLKYCTDYRDSKRNKHIQETGIRESDFTSTKLREIKLRVLELFFICHEERAFKSD